MNKNEFIKKVLDFEGDEITKEDIDSILKESKSVERSNAFSNIYKNETIEETAVRCLRCHSLEDIEINIKTVIGIMNNLEEILRALSTGIHRPRHIEFGMKYKNEFFNIIDKLGISNLFPEKFLVKRSLETKDGLFSFLYGLPEVEKTFNDFITCVYETARNIKSH